jgi:hypothetical protein
MPRGIRGPKTVPAARTRRARKPEATGPTGGQVPDRPAAEGAGPDTPQRRRSRRATQPGSVADAGRQDVVATEEAPHDAALTLLVPEDPQDAALAAAEAELVRRYPGRRIKPGSLRPAGADPAFGHKRTLVLLCTDCDAERTVATSDVFHVGRYADCARTAKKAKKGAAGDGA